MRKLTLTISAIFTFFLGSCQVKVHNDRIVTIPIEIVNNRPVVQVIINKNGPYKFIFDTGSTGNVIDQQLADQLKLKIIGEDLVHTPGSSNSLIVKRFKIDEVAISNSSVKRSAMASAIQIKGLVDVDGILSPGFFEDYLITIDYKNELLTLNKDENLKNEKNTAKLSEDKGIINFEIKVGEINTEAHLDSGNPGGFDLPYAMKDQLKYKSPPKESGVINTPVATFKRWTAILDGDIVIGSVIHHNPTVNLVEGFKTANIGYDIIKDLYITIDIRGKLIHFEKSKGENKEKETQTMSSDTKNEFTGWYGGHIRQVLLEDGVMYLQRGSAPKLKLVNIEKDLYRMTYSMPVMNELPNVRFERTNDGKVKGITFEMADGSKDFTPKDED